MGPEGGVRVYQVDKRRCAFQRQEQLVQRQGAWRGNGIQLEPESPVKDGQMSLGKAVSSVQFSCSVLSDSLRPHELQHTRPPCPSSTPGVHSNSCPSSR